MPFIFGILAVTLNISAAWAAAPLPAPTPPRPLRAAAAAASSRLCLISDHVSDPGNATAGIQAAVDACAAGGTVLFDVPGVNYSTGAVLISGNRIHVRIPPSVALLAGTQRKDYPGPQPSWYALHFRGCAGCSLGGGGALDGRARDYVTGRTFDRKLFRQFSDPSCANPWECRPRMVGIVGSTDFRLYDFHVVDPPYWAMHVLRSRRVALANFSVASDWEFFNTDGLDVDSSVDVDVADCAIDTADDAVCVKTTAPGYPTRRVRVARCALRSRASAVKLGSESVADFEDLSFEDLTVWGGTHRGLAVQLRNGGSVARVAFARISLDLALEEPAWWGVAEPLYLTVAPRAPGRPVGTLTNVSVADIRAVSENGIFIAGQGPREGDRLPGAGLPIRGVRVSNFSLTLKAATAFPGGYQDYRPGPWGVGATGGTAALWVAGAADVALEGVAVAYAAPARPDWRERVVLGGDVEGLTVRNCSWGELPAGGAAAAASSDLVCFRNWRAESAF